MLDFSLHLWNDRCDTMHGIDEEDAKRIVNNKITAKVRGGNRGGILIFVQGIHRLLKPEIHPISHKVGGIIQGCG